MILVNSDALSRIKKQIFSGFYGQAVTIIVQIVGPAAMLYFMSPEVYGRWLMLSTVPLYLTITDLGIYTAAMVKMTHFIEIGDNNRANQVFNSALLFSIIVMPSMFFLFSGLASIVPKNFIRSHEEYLILCILVGVSLLSAFFGLIESVYGSNKLLHKSTFYSANSRIFDLIGMTVGVFWGGGSLWAAAGILMTRVVFTIYAVKCVLRDVPHIRWNLFFAKRIIVFDLFSNGIYFFLFPVSNLIMIQGSFLILAHIFGPIFAATFSMHRVLSRIIYQISQIVSKSLNYEISSLNANNDIKKINKLIYAATYKNIIVCFSVMIFIYLIAPKFIEVWSSGKIVFESEIYFLLAMASLFSSIWMIPSVRLMATENHREFTALSLVVSIFAIGILYIMAEIGSGFLAVSVIPAVDFIIIIVVFFIYRKKKWI